MAGSFGSHLDKAAEQDKRKGGVAMARRGKRHGGRHGKRK